MAWNEQRWSHTKEAKDAECILWGEGLLDEDLDKDIRHLPHARYCILVHAAREHLRLGPGWTAELIYGQREWMLCRKRNNAPDVPAASPAGVMFYSSEVDALIAGVLAWEAHPEAEPEPDRLAEAKELLRRASKRILTSDDPRLIRDIAGFLGEYS